jgi:hypothetical protein
MLVQQINELFKILEQFLGQRMNTQWQSSNQNSGKKPFRLFIRVFNHIDDIFKQVHKSQTVEQRNIHQLRQVIEHIDGFIKLELAQMPLQIGDDGLDDQIRLILVLLTDFCS